MPEMHLKQLGFTYSVCGPFTKKQRKNTKIQKKAGDSQYIYQNELHKSCFEHDMAHVDLKIKLEKQEYCALSETLATQNIFAGTSIKNENISKQRIN